MNAAITGVHPDRGRRCSECWVVIDRLPDAIKSEPDARCLAWILAWRNANEADNSDHHYAPYAGHPSDRRLYS